MDNPNKIAILYESDDDYALMHVNGSKYEYKDLIFGVTEPISDSENPSNKYPFYDVYCLKNGVRVHCGDRNFKNAVKSIKRIYDKVAAGLNTPKQKKLEKTYSKLIDAMTDGEPVKLFKKSIK